MKQSHSRARKSRATDEELHIPDELFALVADREFSSKWELAAAASIESSTFHGQEAAWKSRTWEFTRMVKAMERFTHKSADEVFNEIPWHETEFIDEEDQAQFLTEWNSIHFIPDKHPLVWALEMAERSPMTFRDSGAPHKKFKTYALFVSLAGWLQVLVGKNYPIFFPSRTIADLLGLRSKTTVNNYAHFAVKDGFLELVEGHTETKAKRYKFKLAGWTGHIEQFLNRRV